MRWYQRLFISWLILNLVKLSQASDYLSEYDDGDDGNETDPNINEEPQNPTDTNAQPRVAGMNCWVRGDERCNFDDSGCTTDKQRCEVDQSCDGDEDDSTYFCPYTPKEIGDCSIDEGGCDPEMDPWGQCSDSCLDSATGEPIIWPSSDDSEYILSGCKTLRRKCQFPFRHQGKEYHQCTDDGIFDDTKVDFNWCAIQTKPNGEMVTGRWGVCDLETCQPTDETAPTKTAVASFIPENEGEIRGNITFVQQEGGILKISGEITGLPEGDHGFHVHQDVQCPAVEGHFNPDESSHGDVCSHESHAGDLGNIKANEEGVAKVLKYIQPGCKTTLFGDNAILGHALVVHSGQDDLGTGNDAGSLATGNAGGRIACATIEENVQDQAVAWYIYLLIALAVISVLIIALLLFLYYKKFCASWKPNSKPKEKDDIIQNGKGALYDELSIPFIDASPTNTPNVGRSRENLGSKSFFNRTPSIGRSRGSLSNEEATA